MSNAAIIRNYRPSDFEQIRSIHEASNIDYKMPVIDSRLFVVKKVLEVDGIVRQAVGFRLEVETYLWSDQSDWALPEEKFLGLQALQAESMHDLMTKGVDTAVCWVPANVDKYFAKRMTQLGWQPDREGWRSWSRKTRSE
jgi:hypothetical protein